MPGEAFGSPDTETDRASLKTMVLVKTSRGDTGADFDEMLALSGTLGEPLSIDSDPYKAQSAPSIGCSLRRFSE